MRDAVVQIRVRVGWLVTVRGAVRGRVGVHGVGARRHGHEAGRGSRVVGLQVTVVHGPGTEVKNDIDMSKVQDV